MTLCDTGPLVALIDKRDPHHARCVAALAALPPSPLFTTWPCLTEAMHLLYRASGISAQNILWQYLSDRLILLHLGPEYEWRRMQELMNQYADMPLDLADASLIMAADQLGDCRLFTVDNRLRVVRLESGQHFDIVS